MKKTCSLLFASILFSACSTAQKTDVFTKNESLSLAAETEKRDIASSSANSIGRLINYCEGNASNGVPVQLRYVRDIYRSGNAGPNGSSFFAVLTFDNCQVPFAVYEDKNAYFGNFKKTYDGSYTCNPANEEYGFGDKQTLTLSKSTVGQAKVKGSISNGLQFDLKCKFSFDK